MTHTTASMSKDETGRVNRTVTRRTSLATLDDREKHGDFTIASPFDARRG
jgi:hypothetical protein